ARTLDALTDSDVTRARSAIQALKPDFDWAPIAQRTADLFERVVLDEP
ncbi:MAG: glycosyltransferase family 1 protein, partial [Acidimicrobiia bacterium]|nr:glycosyltransferase family 1 protein [Acidimicrobiia bacterium]